MFSAIASEEVRDILDALRLARILLECNSLCEQIQLHLHDVSLPKAA